MIPIREKWAEVKIREKARELGGVAIKIFSAWLTGLPDRLILLPGAWMVWCEVKTTGEHPTPKQLIVHEMLRKLGFMVLVVDSGESLQDLFNRMEDGRV